MRAGDLIALNMVKLLVFHKVSKVKRSVSCRDVCRVAYEYKVTALDLTDLMNH